RPQPADLCPKHHDGEASGLHQSRAEDLCRLAPGAAGGEPVRGSARKAGTSCQGAGILARESADWRRSGPGPRERDLDFCYLVVVAVVVSTAVAAVAVVLVMASV